MLGNFLFQASRRIISLALIFSLALSPTFSYAQSAFISTLPEPGKMVGISEAFTPILVKGLVVHPDKPLNFDFIVDSGNDSTEQVAIKDQSEKIVRYFLAALTVPEDQLWVNLSPYEKDRIIADELGQTVLGRDMLAQDYVLKQLTASMIYPEDKLGKDFWTRIYKEAQEKFGTTDIPVDTFNKVWIVPEKAVVFEKDNAVYVTEAKLRVMLDSDYTAMSKNSSTAANPDELKTDAKAAFTKEVIRQVVLPAIEKEVNSGKNFATLRQVYYAAILAKWYRELVQDTLMSKAYVGKNKVAGVSSDDKTLKEQIYQRYISAYKKGVFNFIKEESNIATGEAVPHKYFSGGLDKFGKINLDRASTPRNISKVGRAFKLTYLMDKTGDAAMTLPWTTKWYIQKGLRNPDPVKRAAVVKLLAERYKRINKLADKNAIRDALLARLYGESDVLVRKGVLSSLLSIGVSSQAIKEGLSQLLGDSDKNVRGLAATDLKEEMKASDAELAGGYVKALTNDSYGACVEAIKQLRQLKITNTGSSILAFARNSKDNDLRKLAVNAIIDIGGQEAILLTIARTKLAQKIASFNGKNRSDEDYIYDLIFNAYDLLVSGQTDFNISFQKEISHYVHYDEETSIAVEDGNSGSMGSEGGVTDEGRPYYISRDSVTASVQAWTQITTTYAAWDKKVVASPERMEIIKSGDSAMLPVSSPALSGDIDPTVIKDSAEQGLNGGIDINNIGLEKKASREKIRFNDAAMKEIFNGGFDGFTPVLINITPVQSPLMILGVTQPEPKDIKA
ncbi:MAG: hypothetical protein HGA87_03000 [Desulfobulbaceae bacterium]|nr:hypothetical protein [Desulfobulbaceae bacterium]